MKTHANHDPDGGSSGLRMFRFPNADDMDGQITVQYRAPSGQWVTISGEMAHDITRSEFMQQYRAYMPKNPDDIVNFCAQMLDDEGNEIPGGRSMAVPVSGRDPALVPSSSHEHNTPRAAASNEGSTAVIMEMMRQLQTTIAEERSLRADLQRQLLEATSAKEATTAGMYGDIIARSAEIQGRASDTQLSFFQQQQREREEENRRRREEDDRRREDEREQRKRDLEDERERRRLEREERESEAKMERDRIRAEAEARAIALKAEADAKVAEIKAQQDAERARIEAQAEAERQRHERALEQDRLRMEKAIEDERNRIAERRRDEQELMAKREELQERHFAMQMELIRGLNPSGKSDTDRLMEVLTVTAPTLLEKIGIGKEEIKSLAGKMLGRFLGEEDTDGESASTGVMEIMGKVVENLGPGAMELARDFVRSRNHAPATIPAPVQNVPVPPPPAPLNPAQPAIATNPIPTALPAPEPQPAPVATPKDPAVQAVAELVGKIHASAGNDWGNVVAALMTPELAAYIDTVGAHAALVDTGDLQEAYYPAIKAACEAAIGKQLRD